MQAKKWINKSRFFSWDDLRPIFLLAYSIYIIYIIFIYIYIKSHFKKVQKQKSKYSKLIAVFINFNQEIIKGMSSFEILTFTAS